MQLFHWFLSPPVVFHLGKSGNITQNSKIRGMPLIRERSVIDLVCYFW